MPTNMKVYNLVFGFEVIMDNKDLKNILVLACLLLIIGCFVVPLIIIFVFSFDTPFIPSAKWSPADALIYSSGLMTFIGTIILGYVSYKQTKVANNMAEKAKDVAVQSYETNAFTRFVDYERSNIDALISFFDKFCDLCSPQTFGFLQIELCDSIVSNNGKLDVCIHNIISYKNQVTRAFETLSRFLRQDRKLRADDENKLKITLGNLFFCVHSQIDGLTSENFMAAPSMPSSEAENMRVFQSLFEEFYKEKERYIIYRETFFRNLLLQNISLDDVSNFYSDVE